MTENLLQNLEDKILLLLTELETLRKNISQIQHENASLKAEKMHSAKKLQGLVSLFDALEPAQISLTTNTLEVLQG